jgi:WD40 repeat protein
MPLGAIRCQEAFSSPLNIDGLEAMALTRKKFVAVLATALGVVGGLAAQQVDRLGDPLPAGAVLRLGSARLSHQGTVSCVAYSPDGTMLATGGGYFDFTIRLWEPATGKEILRHKLEGPVRDLVWSKDGKLLVTANDGGGVRFWDPTTGKQVRQFSKLGTVVRLAFSNDGKTLAAGGADFTGTKSTVLLRLLDAADGTELHRFEVARAYNVAFSPDGQTLAMGGEDKKIRLWDVSSGKELPPLEGHTGTTYAVAFSPNGKILASGVSYGDPSVRLWDWAAGRIVHRLGPLHDYGVHCLLFTADGQMLAAGSSNPDGVISLWQVATGKPIRQLKGHRSPIDSFAFAPDGKTIASSGSWERSVRLWDVANGKERSPFPRHHGEVQDVAFAPDGLTLATACRDHTIGLWKASTGEKIGEILGHGGAVHAVAYSRDGNLLASGSADRTVRIWQAATGKVLHTLPGEKQQGIAAVAFAPDGRTLAAGAGGAPELFISGMRMPDCAVTLWDLGTGLPRHHFKAGAGRVDTVAFSPDGRILASAGPDAAMIHLWDPLTGKELGKLQSASEPNTPPSMAEGVSRIVFFPDGKTLAAVSLYRFPSNMRMIDDKKTREVRVVRLWEIATRKERMQIRLPFRRSGHDPFGDCAGNEVTCAAFSADGQVLILGKKDGDIALWHIPAGKEIRLTRAHQDLVTAVALAPGGKTFASAGRDTTAVLWTAMALHEPWTTPITAKDCASRWADLASADAARAYRAIWALAGAPQEALPFLHERLRPIPQVERGKIARLINSLDANAFIEREKATSELTKLGELAVPDLHKALAKPGSAESRRRMEELLEKHGGPVPSLEILRALRAIEMLERAGTPQAQQLLQVVAEGAEAARLTRDARAALERLTRK